MNIAQIHAMRTEARLIRDDMKEGRPEMLSGIDLHRIVCLVWLERRRSRSASWGENLEGYGDDCYQAMLCY